jgi:hypothetical protein
MRSGKWDITHIIFWVFSTFCSATNTYVAQASVTVEQLFGQAVQKSKAGDFAEAIDLYKKIPGNFQVLSNIASCYYCLGDFANTLLFLKKAQKQATFTQQLQLEERLEVVRAKLGFKSKRVFGAVENAKKILTKMVILCFSVSSFWLEILLVCLWILLIFAFKYSWRRAFVWGAGVSWITVLLFLFFVSGAKQVKTGIILSPDAKFFSGPGKHFLVLGSAVPGSELRLTQKSGDYFKIKIGKKSGWVHAADLAEV